MKLVRAIGAGALAAVVTALVVTATAQPGAAAGATVHVVNPGGSIQAAVDAAAVGDTILLKAGTYAGGVLIAKSSLTIRGAGPTTVLRPRPGNNCVKATGGRASASSARRARASTGSLSRTSPCGALTGTAWSASTPTACGSAA